MSELTEHVALMQKQRASISSQIAKLYDGQKKADLNLKLADIDDQLGMIERASAAPVKTLRSKSITSPTGD